MHPAVIRVSLQQSLRDARLRTPAARRLRSALARVGRGAVLGLHLIPGVVRADVWEHDDPRRRLPPGVIIVRVCGDLDALADVAGVLSEWAPAGVQVVAVLELPRLWDRIVGRWRALTFRMEPTV